MHYMLPSNLAMVPQILFEFLELREYVRVIGAVDVLREKMWRISISSLASAVHVSTSGEYRHSNRFGLALRARRTNFSVSQ
jgi:hypothetical protein